MNIIIGIAAIILAITGIIFIASSGKEYEYEDDE